MIGIRIVLKKAWAIINDERSSEKAVANALHLVLDCYSFKRQLLVDVTNIAPVIRDFIEDRARAAKASTNGGVFKETGGLWSRNGRG
jgi:hypothetical protein